MAHPGGYSNVPPASGPVGSMGSNMIPNGQPPQWSKPPAFPAIKSLAPSYINPQHMNSSNPIASNGTPTSQNYSNPGSISSQSSRDPSPVPPNRLCGTSQSLENLLHSNSNLNSFGNSHSPRITPSMSPVPPADAQQPSRGTVLHSSTQLHGSQTLAQSSSAVQTPGMQVRATNQGTVGDQYSHGSRGIVGAGAPIAGPPKSASPLGVSNHQNRTGSLQDIPLHSSLNQHQRTGQGDGRPGLSARSTPTHMGQRSYSGSTSSVSSLHTSVNGPAGLQHYTRSPLPPTPSQQGQSSQSSGTGKPLESSLNQSVPGQHSASLSAQFSGVPPTSGLGHLPTQSGQYQSSSKPLMPPTSQVPSISPAGQPGSSSKSSVPTSSQPAQYTNKMPSPRPSIPQSNQLGQYSNMPPTSQPGQYSNMPPMGPPGQYPSMPPTSQSRQYSSMSPASQPGQYPSMPPTSQPGQYPSMPPTNQPGQYPSMPPTSQPRQYPSMPPQSQPGQHPNRPLQSQPGQYTSMPPPSQPGQHPGMPPQSQPGQYPGMPPPSLPGQHPSMPPTGQPGPHPSIPPQSQPGQDPGMLPQSQPGQHPSIPPPSQPGQHPSMPPPSQAGQHPGMPPQSQPGQYTSMPPPSQPGQRPTMPPTSQPGQYPSMPPSQLGQVPGMPPSTLPSSHPGQYPGMGPPPMQNQYPTASQQESTHLAKRYPHQQGYPQQNQPAGDVLQSQMSNLSVSQSGFNKLWGHECYDLLQSRNILPPEKIEPPPVRLHQEFLDNVNCSSEIFRCTLTKIPETSSLLQKSRLPLGILVHPFKDLNHLPVIQCSTIVRCRSCRTYINPFVYFVDHKRWKCNLCFRVNELPEEFQYDPVSKTYGDPTRRPEIKSSTIEFIAPSEYMLRPPQPAVYLFLLDVSRLGVESGYLQLFCDVLLDELERLPGDGRTQVGFITYDSHVHFYNMAEGLSQPQQMIVVDTDDIFLPCPDNLLVNLAECRELVRDLLHQLPLRFQESHDTNSTLGPALQAAYKLMAPTGGRVTVFQACLPTVGPGGLVSREDPTQRAGKEAPHLNPATDFYKRLALDCSGQQVAVDLFIVNSQYCDLATLSGVSRFSGGCIHHFPLFKASNVLQAESLERAFRRYLSRKVGFEAVMRIRCSRGLAIHTFHGNFFVRSTDLLSLPNVNPDAGFGMQVSVEESLAEVQNVCFQAALLYTTSKGERRIRVHTLCLPVATTLTDILHSADQQCIVGLLAKMAVDRSHQSSLSDARDAFINVAIDVLSAYRLVQNSGATTGGLLAPHNLRLLPLYILALLKYVAFRTGQSTRLDDRLFAMCQMKSLPLTALIQALYPDLYPVHELEEQLVATEDGGSVPQPPRLHLSAEKLDFRGAFLLDTGEHMILYVGRNISTEFCTDVIGVPSFSLIPEEMLDLPVLETTKSENLRNFISHLQSERPYCATLEIIRDDSKNRVRFTERLIEDRTESALSYYEFLQHLKTNVK